MSTSLLTTVSRWQKKVLNKNLFQTSNIQTQERDTMDKFKAMSQKEIGIGGIKCPCCAPQDRKGRKALQRRARRRLKAEDKKNNSF